MDDAVKTSQVHSCHFISGRGGPYNGGQDDNHGVEEWGAPCREGKELPSVFSEEDRIKSEINDATQALQPALRERVRTRKRSSE